MAKCDRCKFRGFEHGKSFLDVTYKCEKGKTDLSQVENLEYFEVECDEFKSRYIEFPLTISGIDRPEGKAIREGLIREQGALVKIRPCGKEYGDKTYLGIYLGDADIGLFCSHNTKTGILSIKRSYNPAIFIPELRKIIYGCESWWGIIENESEIKEITDDDIDNVWYVKLLKAASNQP